MATSVAVVLASLIGAWVAIGVSAWGPSGTDTVEAATTQRMQRLASDLRADPGAAARMLPDGVASHYQPLAAGEGTLHGWLYQSLPDGRCVVLDISADRLWLETGEAQSLRVEGPTTRVGCPGDVDQADLNPGAGGR